MELHGLRTLLVRAAGPLLFLGVLALGCPDRLAAQGINPRAYQQKFEQAKPKADVVAEVRVLAVACTRAEKGEAGSSKLTLELCLHVLKSEKGPARKGELLVVRRTVDWSTRPGPPALYARQGNMRMFPLVPGAQGQVALKWDDQHRRYTGLAGWVPELSQGNLPMKAGQVVAAGAAPAGG